MIPFNKVKNIVVEEENIVIFLEFNKELVITLEEIDKIFIKVQKSKLHVFYAIVLMSLPIFLFYFAILPINVTLLVALAILTFSIVIGFNSNQYKLIVRSKTKEVYNFTISADSKFKILEKVRIVRTKLHEINFNSAISPVVND